MIYIPLINTLLTKFNQWRGVPFSWLHHARTHATLVPLPGLASDAGKPPRDLSAFINTRSRHPLTQPCFFEGKCIVAANSLSSRSLSTPFYLLCQGNIFIWRDNTVKAGRVLADFWSNHTFICSKMPRTKKKNGRGRRAALLWPSICVSSVLVGSCSFSRVANPLRWLERV